MKTKADIFTGYVVRERVIEVVKFKLCKSGEAKVIENNQAFSYRTFVFRDRIHDSPKQALEAYLAGTRKTVTHLMGKIDEAKQDGAWASAEIALLTSV